WRRRTTWRLAGSATGARPQSAGRSIGRPTRRKPTGRKPTGRQPARRRSTRRPARWTEGRPGRNKTLRVVLSTPEAHDELSHQRYGREPSCFRRWYKGSSPFSVIRLGLQSTLRRQEG